MNDITKTRVAFLITTMGYGDQLLYWEPVLQEVTQRMPNSHIFLQKSIRTEPDCKLPISKSIRSFRYIVKSKQAAKYHRVITIIDPRIMLEVSRFKPAVIILSEFGLLTVYGILYSFFHRNCRILLLVESDPGKLGNLRTYMRRIISKFADVILTNNQAGENYLLQELRVDKRKIRQSPYMVSQPRQFVNDTTEILDNDYFADDQVKFLYVGQIAKRKGLEQLILALSELSENHLDKLCIEIVGDGDDAQKQILMEMIDSNQLNKCVQFLGRKPYSELEKIYKKSDVFLLPTLNDYRALVGFEAISHGLPALISRYDGACSEVVDHGINGLIFDPLDRSDFSSKLAWFIDNRKKLHEMGQHSKKLSRAFTVEVAANTLLDSITACLAKNQASRVTNS